MAYDATGGYFLPRLIRFARLRAGWTQRDLATACGVVQPAVVAWESGRRATSEETLVKIAGAMGHPDVERFICTEVAHWIADSRIIEFPRRRRKETTRERPQPDQHERPDPR